MKRVLVAAAAAVLVVGLAGSVSATWVRPPIANLNNRDGEWSECLVDANKPYLIPQESGFGPGFPYDGLEGADGWHWAELDLRCQQEGWNAGEWRWRMQTIDAGVRGRLLTGTFIEWDTFDEFPDHYSIAMQDFYFNACLIKADGEYTTVSQDGQPWLLPKGPHEFLYGTWAKVNLNNGDGMPYVGVAERLDTVTCTKDRRAYR